MDRVMFENAAAATRQIEGAVATVRKLLERPVMTNGYAILVMPNEVVTDLRAAEAVINAAISLYRETKWPSRAQYEQAAAAGPTGGHGGNPRSPA
jgi:hypothetical protein